MRQKETPSYKEMLQSEEEGMSYESSESEGVKKLIVDFAKIFCCLQLIFELLVDVAV